MKRPLITVALVGAVTLGGSAAHAQLAVYDAASYAKLIQQATTAVSQLNELKAQVTQGQQLFSSLNDASGVSKIASALVLHDETPRGRLFHFGFEWQYRARYRSVDEEIDRYLSVTREEVNRFLERRPFDVISVTDLGPLSELS